MALKKWRPSRSILHTIQESTFLRSQPTTRVPITTLDGSPSFFSRTTTRKLTRNFYLSIFLFNPDIQLSIFRLVLFLNPHINPQINLHVPSPTTNGTTIPKG